MNTTEIIKKVLRRKDVQDYSYLIFFLLLSSFFILFVIRPVLSVAVGLQKEAIELRQLNGLYERDILKIVQLQDQLQEIRPLEYLYDIAFPHDPKLQDLLKDLRALAENDAMTIESIETSNVSYIENGASAKKIKLSVRTKGSYEHSKLFVEGILAQKRLKVIDVLHLSTSSKANKGSQELSMDIDIVASYY